ncbi:hypothetical protein FQA39_LY06324 [Lamprigera yunnana]|nr:hypothetical protein FQA39_LY06324 [Lamprigera yunnana]
MTPRLGGDLNNTIFDLLLQERAKLFAASRDDIVHSAELEDASTRDTISTGEIIKVLGHTKQPLKFRDLSENINVMLPTLKRSSSRKTVISM